MMQNKEKSEAIQNNVKSLREQIKILEQSIKEYTNFSGTDYEVVKIFQLVQEFFVKQGSEGHISEENKKTLNGIKNYVPFQDQVKPGDKPKVD